MWQGRGREASPYADLECSTPRGLSSILLPKLAGGPWPEQPSLRFLIHWALRKDELCEPNLCPDAPDDGDRCDHCPLKRRVAPMVRGGSPIHRACISHCLMLTSTRSGFRD